MNLLTNSKSIHLFWWIFAPLLVAKLLLSVGDFFWDIEVFEPLHVKKVNTLHVYDFPKLYEKENLQKKVRKRSFVRFENIHLKACYIESNKKFIIIEENRKTYFINIKEEYKGAKLIEVKSNSAIFEHNGEQIALNLQKIKSLQTNYKKIQKKRRNEKYISIRKEDLKKYIKDTKEILKDIKIEEVIQNKSFKGLKIVFLRKGSLFDTMQLKEGDILKTIDNKKISSTISLMPHYSNLNNSSALKIGIQRDGKMKEMVYEID